jgi:TetR/AcrR family transcriptional regulator, cholesterol catabolism regulator
MDNRERIIEGAVELFKTYGIKSMTMDSLSGNLGMSKRTIYEVFKDKDELVIGVLKWMAKRQKEIIKSVLDKSENSIVAIFKMLEINHDNFHDMSPAFKADLKKYHHDVLMKNYDKSEMPDFRNHQELIENGIREKLFRKDINPDIANRCLYYLGRSVMDYDLYPYQLFSRREVLRNIFINYLRGIATPTGLVLIDRLERKF